MGMRSGWRQLDKKSEVPKKGWVFYNGTTKNGYPWRCPLLEGVRGGRGRSKGAEGEGLGPEVGIGTGN